MSFEGAPLAWSDIKEHLRKLAVAINSLRDGKVNSTGTVTLTASATTTVVSDKRAGPTSFIGLMPTTANAGASAWHIGDRTTGSFTITHTSDPALDRTFIYLIMG